MLNKQRVGSLVVTALAALAACMTAQAQEYPTKPISMVVPYTVGSPTEAEGRKLAAHLERVWKRPIVVENKPGAGATIGVGFVAKAAPDGYTILFSGAAISTFKTLFKELPFDPIEDLVPVAQVYSLTSFVVVNPQTPFKTIEEVIAYAKANPGKLNYGSAGKNTVMLRTEALLRAAGNIKMTEVPYNGESAYLTATIRNDVQFIILSMSGGKGQLVAGTVRPLMVLTEKRHPQYPNVPTAAERGMTGIPDNTWGGVWVPAKTPKAIIDQLAAETARFTADPELQRRGADVGLVYYQSSPEKFKQFIAQESKIWAEVAASVGMKPE